MKKNQSTKHHIEQILLNIGEDPKRQGLLKTPRRVEAAYEFLTSGYKKKPAEVLNNAVFNETRVWNASNTILIDHDPKKLQVNAAQNCLLLPEFTLQSYLNQDPEYSTDKVMAAISSHPLISE